MELCDNCSRTATDVKFYASLDTSLLSVSVHSLLALQDGSLGHNTLKVNRSYSYKKTIYVNMLCSGLSITDLHIRPPGRSMSEI